jgi:ABA4-like protein
MSVTLFNLAGPAVLAWLLLIFAPKWRRTHWLARTAIVPALLCLLYVIGIIALISNAGFGFMRDFGNADGVARLMAQRDIALVAWIHFLAFDQLVGIFIYRDNMHHRYVPIPVQSVILFLTLMRAPVGFLSYYLLRWARADSPSGRSEVTAV